MRALLPTELFILAMMYISNCTLLSSNTVIYVCLYVFCRVAHIRTYLISYSTSMACSHQWPEAIKSASQRFDLHHDFTMNQSHIIQYIPLLPSTPRADLVILSVHSRLFLTIIALSQLSSPCVPAFTCVPLIHLLINKNKDSTALDLEKKKKKIPKSVQRNVGNIEKWSIDSTLFLITFPPLFFPAFVFRSSRLLLDLGISFHAWRYFQLSDVTLCEAEMDNLKSRRLNTSLTSACSTGGCQLPHMHARAHTSGNFALSFFLSFFL